MPKFRRSSTSARGPSECLGLPLSLLFLRSSFLPSRGEQSPRGPASPDAHPSSLCGSWKGGRVAALFTTLAGHLTAAHGGRRRLHPRRSPATGSIPGRRAPFASDGARHAKQARPVASCLRTCSSVAPAILGSGGRQAALPDLGSRAHMRPSWL
ncbi:hypothetical protein NDU88_002222 [Pleurodeles waltl]|uniref:Uncharacterized protein n=1 Tax=Pleurodeles waltl TaxID=8319 RepID=A0AAV7TL55_PLEWA|nr:hypothetical protein NDU88_002222 [Pleurodeles waltl]